MGRAGPALIPCLPHVPQGEGFSVGLGVLASLSSSGPFSGNRIWTQHIHVHLFLRQFMDAFVFMKSNIVVFIYFGDKGFKKI